MAAARRAGGAAALASQVPGAAGCKLSQAQLTRLRTELDKGPAAHGWDQDQRWTLDRVTILIGRLFHVRYTMRGTCYLLHRLGFTPQVPIYRAAPRGRRAAHDAPERPQSTPMQLVCKQVIGTIPSLHSGSSKRPQPHRPASTLPDPHHPIDLHQ